MCPLGRELTIALERLGLTTHVAMKLSWAGSKGRSHYDCIVLVMKEGKGWAIGDRDSKIFVSFVVVIGTRGT